jgi:hypothetical protein
MKSQRKRSEARTKQESDSTSRAEAGQSLGDAIKEETVRTNGNLAKQTEKARGKTMEKNETSGKNELSDMIQDAVADCETFGAGRSEGKSIDIAAEWMQNETSIEVTFFDKRGRIIFNYELTGMAETEAEK